ncbi:uncharacterized protein Z520_09950 [Fonsecaea multimorphosa CBS 102226]|uniref:Uncharacterized protein n=1 Tax=Fonsecaea multimorphosa CBS 102226 TaxID=1442371 RepID=A0A0D2GXE2_9EURO|nr:uncharacterized protein Z520_09950 [Fonsecaea multimorphosa CBS 102226]KIX94240.1 hypothetical protein Z520_09950 [Fonsecaea multimorphosa CBS 102226]OAL19922.1 hypothetical protein AYO22_09449 [Fonsecaea multimorphosa]
MHIPTAASTVNASPIASLHLFAQEDGSQPGGGYEKWSSFIGIVTAIVGNLLISFALNTQRYAHILIDREYSESRKSFANGHTASGHVPGAADDEQEEIAEERRRKNLETSDRKRSVDEESSGSAQRSSQDTLQPSLGPAQQDHRREKDSTSDTERASYLKSPYWWLGLVLMIIGEAGNFLAYGFAPASIVSPLGVVALISNCLIAPLMLKERFRRRDLYGVLVAIAGAVTVVLSARSSEAKFGPGELWKTIKRWEFLLYVIITVVLIGALMYAEPRYGRKTLLVDLGLVALCGGYTALSTKGVSSLLSVSLYKAFTFAIFYFLVLVLVASALMQIRYLNRALQNYDSTQVIPTQFVLFTLSVIIGSAVLYRDFEHTTLDQAIKFVIGCLLTFFGVYLITSQRHEIGEAEELARDEEETIQLIDEEAEDVDERTPLNRDAPKPTRPQVDGYPVITNSEQAQAVTATPHTPRRLSNASSVLPSISVTPAEPSEDLISNPWLSSTEQFDASLPPSTPQTGGAREEFTPFYTPGTSRPLQRSASSPAEPETPSKLSASPRPPSPDRSARPTPDDNSPSPSFLARGGRGSISRLFPLPGPLLPPLSNSLSALVADSLLRGEGSPRSVRAALRRPRSGRHSIDDRRRTVAAIGDTDGFDPLAALNMHWQNHSADSAQELSRAQTHEARPPGVQGDGDEADLALDGESDSAKRKTRLRALSETLSGMMSRRSSGRKQSESHGKGKDGPETADDGGEDTTGSAAEQ